MDSHFDRREFLKVSAAAGTATMAGLGLPRTSQAQGRAGRPPKETIRLGFVGIGGRGSYHLDAALGMEDVVVVALSEIQPERLQRAKEWVEAAGQPTPALYGDGERAFERMVAEEELDCVICSTDWKWHAPVALASMRHDKHCVSEVPLVQTVDEAWEIVETYEQTGYWATLALEQVLLESGDGLWLNVLHMINEGLLGDIIHAEGGYVHDLRRVKHDPEEEPWRLQHSIDRNGNLYPDHPMNRMIPFLDINRGDRFDFLMSMSSRSGMLNEFAKTWYGPDHPNVTKEMKQGDFNATILKTVDGKLVTLNFDTNTPHPRGLFRVQGTDGVLIDGRGVGGPRIYLDGITPESHRWEPAEPYLEKFTHPLVAAYDPPEREAIRGHGGRASRTPLTWHLLIENLRHDTMPYFDVYDSVTSSVVSPLSEKSVEMKSRPVDFPDFTRGEWRNRPRLTMLDFVSLV